MAKRSSSCTPPPFASATSLNRLNTSISSSPSSDTPNVSRRVLRAWRPECLPRKIPAESLRTMPTRSGSMISYVVLFLSMPSWWMPDSCAKAFCPTMALCGCTAMPVYSATMREVREMCSMLRPVNRPFMWSWPRRSSATATSSREALPARSPMPLMVHSIWRAPFTAPARELPVERPRSFWQCVEITTSSAPGVFALIFAIRSPNSSGIVMPTVSGMLMVVAPALITSPRILYRNSGSERPASSGLNSISVQPKLRQYLTASTASATT
mmetsp:Transcript_26483/g.57560  ORF Transcript_26483/g.57560 Transcript_26483/m.57560 type:complete len:269 (+) Transcript_26483:828-1634(+)